MGISSRYKCSECGYISIKWLGKCPECNKWNTMEEIQIDNKKTTKSIIFNKTKSVKKLKDVISNKSERIITGISEFDRVMGGGIVKDSISIIGGAPGAGKTTLLTNISNNVAKQGFKVLYTSGEESESQIKNRADRILDKIDENIYTLQENCIDNILEVIEDIDADLIIVDSIQTSIINSALPSRAGSPTQTMECANALLQVAKNEKRPRAVILVGQMTKNEELAGLRSLEHLVDTVLIIENNSEEDIRTGRCTKNRFGDTNETSFYQMVSEEGMVSIDNPSEFFMTKREEGKKVTGSTMTVVKEGMRPIIVEIESLVSKSFTPYPIRIGETLSKDNLNTLISILEQRGKISLYDKNVIIKTVGGLKIKENAINLAVIMSIVSSTKNISIDCDIAFIGDVGLTGELKKVPSMDTRLKELERMGFKTVYIPKDSIKDSMKYNKLNIIQAETLIEIIDSLKK